MLSLHFMLTCTCGGKPVTVLTVHLFIPNSGPLPGTHSLHSAPSLAVPLTSQQLALDEFSMKESLLVFLYALVKVSSSSILAGLPFRLGPGLPYVITKWWVCLTCDSIFFWYFLALMQITVPTYMRWVVLADGPYSCEKAPVVGVPFHINL